MRPLAFSTLKHVCNSNYSLQTSDKCRHVSIRAICPARSVKRSRKTVVAFTKQHEQHTTLAPLIRACSYSNPTTSFHIPYQGRQIGNPWVTNLKVIPVICIINHRQSFRSDLGSRKPWESKGTTSVLAMWKRKHGKVATSSATRACGVAFREVRIFPVADETGSVAPGRGFLQDGPLAEPRVVYSSPLSQNLQKASARSKFSIEKAIVS